MPVLKINMLILFSHFHLQWINLIYHWKVALPALPAFYSGDGMMIKHHSALITGSCSERCVTYLQQERDEGFNFKDLSSFFHQDIVILQFKWNIKWAHDRVPILCSSKADCQNMAVSLGWHSASSYKWRTPTLNPSSTRSWRLRAAWVQVIAMILASFTRRYLDRSRPLRSSSKARNS